MMINLLASILVLLTGLYLIGLALGLFLSPARAKAFLGGFASSAFTHYLELVLRLAGGAILLYAPQMLFPNFFVIFWLDSRGDHRRSLRSSLAVASALCAVQCSLRKSQLTAGRRSFVSFRRIRHCILNTRAAMSNEKAQAYSLISHHYFSVNQT
jgi:hypothetical protein